MDKDSNAAAVASKKPPWDGSAQNAESTKPSSPLAKRESRSIPSVAKQAATGMGGTAMSKGHAALAGEATEPGGQTVRRLPAACGVGSLSWGLCTQRFSSPPGPLLDPAFTAARLTKPTSFNRDTGTSHGPQACFLRKHRRLIKILKWAFKAAKASEIINPQILYHNAVSYFYKYCIFPVSFLIFWSSLW